MPVRPLVPRPERVRLAHRLFDPYRDRMLAKPVQLNKLGQLANVGAALDPRDMLRQLREKASAVPALAADGLREQIVQSLGAENIEEAREVIEEASDPGTKAVMLCQLCQSVTDRAQKRPLLADALVQARASRNPKFHVVGLARGRQLLDFAEKEQGTAVLKEALADAERLPRFGTGFGALRS